MSCWCEVEKEARSDMARIIRQIENEAREEGEYAPARSLQMPSSV